MSLPVPHFDKLSLRSMPPQTRSKAHDESSARPNLPLDDESSSDSESESETSDIDDETSPVIQSPTRITYLVDHLPEKTRATIRDTFKEPPKIALQKCRLIDHTYAFQMTEVVTRSVRIRASGDGVARLSCSCRDDDEPCGHVLWLLDQVLKQTLYDYDPQKPVKMTALGFAEEMGDPFQSIADHHLNILADGLHCHLVTPDSEYDNEVDVYRATEARELLSSIYSSDPEEYRPDITSRRFTRKDIIKQNDLDQSVFRMLLDNHHFFDYFRSLSQPLDPINDIFRKISQRVDHISRDLDHFASSTNVENTAESPRNVTWAANHISGSIGLIKRAIYTRDHPLTLPETISAARTLVHILEVVVSRNRDVHSGANRLERNLYLRLIGDRDQDFVIGVLNLIPGAASQFLNNLESIFDQLGAHGAPATYFEKFRSLLGRLRTSRRGTGLKRQVQGSETGQSSKRMK